jgi:1,4-dihydroxy-2-naphthoate octaprenyltransferase
MTWRNLLIGARLKTQPATLVPLAAGTAVAYSAGPVSVSRALLTWLFAEGFVVGTNYLNDYSDGVRGTDTKRAGPVRLVGSGRMNRYHVLAAGLTCYAIAMVTGVVLAVTVSAWLIALVPLCAFGGWFYTGGRRPYGYRAFGEVSVFAFHGVLAVCATTYIQLGRIPLLALGAAIPVGLLVCALLVTNNLRDIPTDAAAGKITLAVMIGAGRTRVLYVLCIAGAFASGLVLAAGHPWLLLVLGAVPFAVFPLRRVLSGARGADLVPALEQTCVLLLGFGALLTVGLAR